MSYTVASKAIISEIIAGEAVIIDLDTGIYYSMDGCAAYIWHALTQSAPLGEIATALHGCVDAPAEGVIMQQMDALAADCAANGLLTPAPDASAWQPIALPARYPTPTLNLYSDMQTLLLLDPIHESDEMGWPNLPRQTSLP
jgi:hypothetical protein